SPHDLAEQSAKSPGMPVAESDPVEQPRSNGSVAIEVRNLVKDYRSGWFRRRDVHALRGVSFRVERGEIFGLLGPNGAGKTTLIKILLGIVKKSAGEAMLLGHSPGDRNARRHVGYLPEINRVPRHHTANSALTYFG